MNEPVPMTSAGTSPAAATAAPIIKDGSQATFVADVINASREVPVIVDLWAPWCGPCKTLGPILEKVVTAARGAVRLVKINVDESPELSRQLRVQSIPAVYAFKNGQPVDGFIGALPESQVKEFVATLIGGEVGPTPTEEILAEADAARTDGDLAAAAQLYSHVVSTESGNATALAGLALCYIDTGDLELARQTLKLVPPDKANDAAVRSAEAALSLKENAKPASEVDGLAAKVQANPADHQARFDLALAQVGAGLRSEAVDNLLEIVRRSRAWNEEAARKQLVTLFEAFGAKDELTISGRRRLSSLLFT